METWAALGSMAGLGLTSGLRLYATVLAVGLGIRFGFLHPHAGLEHLSVLASPYVLVPAGVAYLAEFFADKIPWVDSAWDFFHTLIRPVGAAVLGAAAVGTVDRKTAVAAMLLCGSVALTSHATKAGTRFLVNHSPEPFSNIAVSFTEDGLAVAGAWLAVQHPLVMLGIVVCFLALFLWLAPKVFRLVRDAARAVAVRLRPNAGRRARVS
jgi:hypothetical protein